MVTWTRRAVFLCVLRLLQFVLLFGSCAASCNHGLRACKDGDVMLGGLFSFNMAGNDNQWGDFSAKELGRAEAVVFAINSINKNSSLLPNVSLGYDIRNYCDSSALAMQIAYDFKRSSDPVCIYKSNFTTSAKSSSTNCAGSKPISALIGPYNSASALLVASLLQVADIPAISSTATSVELSSQFYKDFFRTVPSDKWLAKVMADIIELFEWSYVAAVGLDDSYGRNGILALEKESYNRTTFCIAFYKLIPRLDHREKIEQTVAKIKMHPKIGVIIVWLYGKYLETFITEASKVKIEGKTLILSDGNSIEETLLRDHRFTMLDGSLTIVAYDYPVHAFEEYLKMVTPAKSDEGRVQWREKFWRSQLNCSINKSLDLGIAPCKANLTLHHMLSKLRSSFVSYLIDAVYAIAHALDNIYSCIAKQGFRNTGSCPSVHPTVNGHELQKYLRNVSFDGLTGKVRFDGFGDPLSASYTILNFQRSSATGKYLRKVHVGTWNKDMTPKLRLNTSHLQWKSPSTPLSFCSSECLPGTKKEITSPCCWDCIKCPRGTISTAKGSSNCTRCEPEAKSNHERTMCEKLPVLNITLTATAGIILAVVTSIGFIFTLLVCGTYIKFYNSPVVKASNREISCLLLFAISAVFILAVIELFEPSNSLCSVATFWRYSALNLCITVLFLKTMRITSVFRADKVSQLFAPCFKTLTKQSIFLSVMNLASLSLSALWIFLDPPMRKKIIRSEEYVYLVCRPFDTNIGLALFIAVCFYTLTVALLCTYYAFKGRNIPENFNETKYIGFSMYILLLSSLAYYPVALTFESWYVTLLSCSTTLITSFGLLGCMFGHKVYILLFRPQHNTVEYIRSQVSNFSFNNVPVTRALKG